VQKSHLKATVLHSYFKGSFYLIEANLNGTTIYFEHTEQLESATTIFLKIH
jgi:hypothetical protein